LPSPRSIIARIIFHQPSKRQSDGHTANQRH
jgi:hypothetical protein